MALRETHVEIDFLSDVSGLRDIQRETNNILREAHYLNREFGIQGARMNDLSDESRAMMRSMQQDWHMQRMNANKYRDELIRVQYGYHELNKSAGDYAGNTRAYMREIQNLGKAQKKVTDQMLANDERQRASLIMQVGTLLNRSTQAEKIFANYQRMGNPFYQVNAGALAVADGLNRIALRGAPAALALKMLGPTANMKQLRDMTMMINQGLMRFQMVALAALAANVLLMRGLHKAASKTVPGYADAFKEMSESVRRAFQPMVDVFAMVMKPIYEFITKIADMATAFNEAHPMLAKMIQGTMLLATVLTLFLAPLAIGVGLIGGFHAAFAYLWTLIGPLVTGLAAMSATVWLVAGAIVVAIVAIRKLWTTNETLRTSVIGAWEAIRAKAQEVFDWLGSFLAPIFDSAVQKATEFADAVKAAFSGDFSQIGELFKQLFPTAIAFLVGGLPGLLISASRFIPTIIEGIESRSGDIATTVTELVTSFATFLTTNLPMLVQQGVTILTNIVQGIVTNLPILLGAVLQVLTFLVSSISTLLPVLLQAGIQILMALLNAIVTNLPMLIQAGIQILNTLIQGIITILPQLLQAGLQILTALLNAIVTNLPMLIQAAVQILMALANGIITLLPTLIPVAIQLIMALVNMLIQNLPLIIAAGIQLLTALIQGIVQVLPLLITAALNLITQLANALIQNLPTIIDAGIQILTALINGIIQMLPQLISAAIQLITALLGAIIDNVPALLDAGVQLVQALINGVLQLLGGVISAAGDIGSALLDTLSGIDLFSVGADIVSGLIGGIKSMFGSLSSAAGDLASTVMSKTKGILGINSPSKVFYEYGGWTTEGFANGMQHEMRMVNQASESLTGAAMYSPAQTVSTSSTNQSKNVSFAPVYNINVTGSGEAGNIKEQLDEHARDQWSTLLDLFGTEVAY